MRRWRRTAAHWTALFSRSRAARWLLRHERNAINMFSIARLDLKRLCVRPFAWTLGAITLAIVAWLFLLDLNAFLAAQPKLAAEPGNLGYTDLVAAPHLLTFVQLSLLIAPLITMHAIAGERRAHALPL